MMMDDPLSVKLPIIHKTKRGKYDKTPKSFFKTITRLNEATKARSDTELVYNCPKCGWSTLAEQKFIGKHKIFLANIFFC